MSIVHTYPLHDLIEHELEGDDCVCGPDVEYLEEGAKLIVHHALDGRELKEDARAED